MQKDSFSAGALMGGIVASILIGAAFVCATMGDTLVISAGIFGALGMFVLVATIGIIANNAIEVILRIKKEE